MTVRTLAALLASVATCLGLASPVGALPDDGGVGPYFAPPFRDDCTVHRFGEGEAPEPGAADRRRRERHQTGVMARRSAEGGPEARRGATTQPARPDGGAQQAQDRWLQAGPGADPDDPYCVEYAKRDITLDNGGAVEFLLAEPARVAAALPKCAYWQRDHWSVQVSRGETPLVRWDGSYWFDKGTGQAAARLRGLRVAGEPATLREAARAVEPWSPELADFFRTYSRGGDGTGWSGSHPFDPRCMG